MGFSESQHKLPTYINCSQESLSVCFFNHPMNIRGRKINLICVSHVIVFLDLWTNITITLANLQDGRKFH